MPSPRQRATAKEKQEDWLRELRFIEREKAEQALKHWGIKPGTYFLKESQLQSSELILSSSWKTALHRQRPYLGGNPHLLFIHILRVHSPVVLGQLHSDN